jgi:hypothetical protein
MGRNDLMPLSPAQCRAARALLNWPQEDLVRRSNITERTFADSELIFHLGIGAIMNVPIRFRGRSLGTLNLWHEAGWFEAADAAPGRLLAGLLVPMLFVAG